MRLRHGLAVLLSLCLISSTQADELDERQVIFDSVRAAFLGGEFPLLDRWANEYLSEESRTESGVWKLAAFYATFNYPAFLYGEYSEEAFGRLFDQIDRWSSFNPSSRSAQLVRAMTLVNLGWFYRGSAYAHQLTPEQIEGFTRYTEAGFRYLLSIEETAAIDPQWYVVALKVLVGWGVADEAFDAMFDEAIRAHPRYHEILFALVRRNLPIWAGEPGSLDAALRRILSIGLDAEYYARAYWFAGDEYYRHEVLFATGASWLMVRDGFQLMLERYPSNWNLNKFSAFACLAQDRETARSLLAAIEGNVVPEAWYDARMYADCQVWAETSGLP